MTRFRTLRKLTHVQIATTVVALTWAACPFVFAGERAKQLVRDTLIRQFEDAGTRGLVDQILDIAYSANASPMTASTLVLPTSLTIDRPEGTYVIDNLDVANKVVSGTVTVYDADGGYVNTVDVAQVTVPDSNRIDYAVSVDSPSGSWSERGSLTGVTEEEGIAIQLASIDGGDTTINVVNYKPLLEKTLTTSSNRASLVSTTPYGSGSANFGTVAAEPITTTAVVIVVVVIVVAACIVFCWLFF